MYEATKQRLSASVDAEITLGHAEKVAGEGRAFAAGGLQVQDDGGTVVHRRCGAFDAPGRAAGAVLARFARPARA
jgi:hypothetical protein